MLLPRGSGGLRGSSSRSKVLTSLTLPASFVDFILYAGDKSAITDVSITPALEICDDINYRMLMGAWCDTNFKMIIMLISIDASIRKNISLLVKKY